MWPVLLDMTKEESMQHLRCLELDAFSSLVNAFRAQGTLNTEKLQLLRETSGMLHISQERHKAEIRRVVNDERLNTIAYHVNGERQCGEEWAEEGQRLIPLIHRVAPQTAYSAIADEVADATSKANKQLPLPSSTERRRVNASPTHTTTTSSTNSSPGMFRASECIEGGRKRKHSATMEQNCALAQHLMAPAKMSKIQQIYRQRSKSKFKEQLVKLKPPATTAPDTTQPTTPKNDTTLREPSVHQPVRSTLQKSSIAKLQMQPQTISKPSNQSPSTIPKPKINILQNITSTVTRRYLKVPQPVPNKESKTNRIEHHNDHHDKKQDRVSCPSQLALSTATSGNVKNTSKTITTTDGQTLIVVSTHSNHTLSPSPSILQRTLTTVPIRSISANPKFRIIPKVTNSSALAGCHGQTNAVTTLSKPTIKKYRDPKGGSPNNIVPISSVQVLASKTGYKVLPIVTNPKVESKTSQFKEAPRAKKFWLGEVQNDVQSSGAVPDVDFELVEGSHVNSRLMSDECIKIEDEDEYEQVENAFESKVQDCHELNGVEKDANNGDLHVEDVNEISDNCTRDLNHDNGVDCIEIDAADDSLHNDHDVSFENVEHFDENNVVVEDTISEVPVIAEINHIETEVQDMNEQKLDFDSSLFIYGTDDNTSEEVIIDGISNQSTEVLNAVHALDECMPNVKNVRS